MKGTRDISWGHLLTPGPQAVPECPNGQTAPVDTNSTNTWIKISLIPAELSKFLSMYRELKLKG
ncbi:unnamed protein product, partial [Staurois parvus]